jgi:ABC-type multidrug transport system fused ATPase/permease subunit
VEANSLERIQQYLEIEKEPEPKESGTPPAYWPASGDLRVENLVARYSADGPVVLDKISFHIKSGERVGVGEWLCFHPRSLCTDFLVPVGRTGSGKSTLTLALLRCIVTGGLMYYDSVPVHSINLDALRSNITIIPQAVSTFAHPT